MERWLLPEGVAEVLPPEAARLERMRRALLDRFHCWGYDLVMPPLLEYLDSLLVGTGHDLELQTFKVIDQLTGRLMGIRADMTPQVARIDAHHLRRQGPVRLCYFGPVLHTLPDGFAGTRSPLQVGAELYGHAGIESDVEVLTLMLECLAVAGVTDVHLDVGHVGVFRGLAEAARLSPRLERELFEALQRKAGPEVETILSGAIPGAAEASMLRALVELNGGPEVLAQARVLLAAAPPGVQSALDDLERVAGSMALRVPALPLYFDLAELRGYAYQTGVVFAAFVPGHGQEIARGGRYDAIGQSFGRARPATGFSTDLKTLARLAEPPADEPDQGAILAPWSDDPALASRVAALRAAGERVVYELPEQIGGPAASGCGRALLKQGDGWIVATLAARP